MEHTEDAKSPAGAPSAGKVMEERIGTLRSVAEGPRWAKFPNILRNRCYVLGLELEMEVDKGWFTEKVRFTIKGGESALRKIKREIRDRGWV